MGSTDIPAGPAYLYLLAPEVRFLEAAVERLIPTDELGPGARDAGVVVFIDRQLASTWGMHGRQYRMGPWPEGTPQQGFQSRLTPQEIYRTAIREIDEACVARFGKPFAFLPADGQDALLRELEADALSLPSLRSGLFFTLLLRNTQEGYFADPLHGGNRDKVGWRLIGFPGVAAGNYKEWLQRYNEPYRVEPVSILDIQEGRARLDAQDYPRHEPLPAAAKEPRP